MISFKGMGIPVSEKTRSKEWRSGTRRNKRMARRYGQGIRDSRDPICQLRHDVARMVAREIRKQRALYGDASPVLLPTGMFTSHPVLVPTSLARAIERTEIL